MPVQVYILLYYKQDKHHSTAHSLCNNTA